MDLKKHQQELGFLVLFLLIFLTWFIGKQFSLDVGAIQERLAGFPFLYSGTLFIVLYVAVGFFIWFAKDAFWLMGAVLFGAPASALLIFLAEVANAAILFYLSRHLGRGFLEKSLSGRYKKLDEKLGRIGFAWLFIFRAAPLIPYRFLDIAAGLTSMRFRRYFLAVCLGSPLKIFWIQYILYGVGKNVYNLTALVDYFLQNRSLLALSAAYFFLVPLVIIKLKKKS
jgi:uncharacterized membrane protein YdjX (TVP38/TMEM64 family)